MDRDLIEALKDEAGRLRLTQMEVGHQTNVFRKTAELFEGLAADLDASVASHAEAEHDHIERIIGEVF